MVQDHKDYDVEIGKQIDEERHYKKVNSNPLPVIRKEILKLTTEGKEQGYISKKEFEFLNAENPRTLSYTQFPRSTRAPPIPPVAPYYLVAVVC